MNWGKYRESVNLAALENDIINAQGTFQWYEGNPNTGGTVISNPTGLTPIMDTDYYVVFTTNTGCISMTSATLTVNSLTPLNAIPVTQVCMGGSIELSDYDGLLTTEMGTFEYSVGGIVITGTFLVPSGFTTCEVSFTDQNGCVSNTSFEIEGLGAVEGAMASYDCQGNQIIVDLSNVIGGISSGYIVSPSSPNQDGEILANNSSWTIIIEDDNACQQAEITGIVDCIVCDAGDAVTADNTIVCCGDSIQVSIENETLLPGNIIGYALTTSADGPVTQEADLDNAIELFQGDAGNALEYISSCGLDAGDYLLSPFVSEEPEQLAQLVYDTLNGCRPNGELCPEIGGTDWILDPLILHFPDGSFLNINDDQAFGLPITPDLLDLVGGIPCLSLTDLYAGDPNGVWWFEINNVGTGDLIFSMPAFDVMVDADSCSALNGVDQVITISSINGTVITGTEDSIGFALPPSGDFPTIGPTCESYGNPLMFTILDESNPACYPVSNNEISNIESFHAYPNPTKGDYSLELGLEEAAAIQISVTDILGREIIRESFDLPSGLFTHTLDLKQLSSGIYMVNITSGKDILSKKVMKP